MYLQKNVYVNIYSNVTHDNQNLKAMQIYHN